MFNEHQISISEWYMKDHVTEDWSNDAENSALPITEINCIKKNNNNEIAILNCSNIS